MTTRSVLRVVARVGDAGDAAARAGRRAPRGVRDALARRRERVVFWIASVATLVLYSLAIGDVAISASGRWADAAGVRLAPDGLFRARAPYLFEPVVELHPGAHLAVFLSPVNLLLGVVVSLLVGANLAVAAHGARQDVACRRPGYGRVLGVLPAFLLGLACCVPTFVLALGAGTAAAILPVLLPLRPVFYPLTLLLLIGSLVWGTHRVHSR